MFNPSFKELEEKGGNRYTLVLLISKRARQLIAGQDPMVNTNSKRQVSIALEELFEDKIGFTEYHEEKNAKLSCEERLEHLDEESVDEESND